ncbi:MAG TPA: glycosyltransferase family 4 protein [Vicinamibacterales bacterium]|nr:glycosyltransferase family 4 protein [Vicinamibacterales bacterium]
MIVHQWLPAAHRGDAIGDSARQVRTLLRAMGHQSDIFALTIDDDMRGAVRSFAEPDATRGDLTIFHFAVPSPMSAAFAALPRGRVLQYHNVTPAHFFAPYDPGIFRIAALGRQELATLAGATDLALGDSDYNRRELAELGFRRTGVLPIAVDTGRLLDAPPHPAIEEILRDGLTNFLFVGRIAPNKRIEDIIRLAEQFKRYIDAQYRFVFVGRTDTVPRYYAAVRALIARYQMLPERFLFPGVVSDWELAAYYRTASVYISMSEHEGFCVPLVEAMAADVPVLAFASTAVPETLGGAGVLFESKDMEYAAELLGQLAFDPDVRARVIEGQRRRLRDFAEDRLRARLAQVVRDASGT